MYRGVNISSIRFGLGIACWLSALCAVPAARAADPLCSWSVEQLKSWRATLANDLAKEYAQSSNKVPQRGAGASLFFSFSTRACTEAKRAWSCSFATDPDRRGILDRIVSSTIHLCSVRGRSMGLKISDAEYLRQARAPLGGALLEIPAELKKAYLSGSEAAIREKAAARSWKVLGFYSASVGNPPTSSHDRILVRADQGDFEQWIQFTSPIGSEQAVDMITLLKKENGRVLERPKIFFTGFWRNGRQLSRKGDVGGSNLSKCWACHPSGLREISGAKNVDNKQVLTEFNSAMRAMPAVDFGPGYTHGSIGPAMGIPAPNRAAILKRCAPAKSHATIRAAINCNMCHSVGGMRGHLDAGLVPYQLRHKLITQSMPPGGSGIAGDAFLACLKAEYAETYRLWLQTTPVTAPRLSDRAGEQPEGTTAPVQGSSGGDEPLEIESDQETQWSHEFTSG